MRHETHKPPPRDPGPWQDIRASFAALLDAAVDAIILINEKGLITDFNRAAEKMFGYSADEVRGRNVNILMPQPYRREHDGYVQRYLKTGNPRIIGIGREVVGRKSDGTEFPIELSVGEIQQAAKRGFVGIIRDITRRKQDEERLRQQEQGLQLIFQNAATAIATFDLSGQCLVSNRAWVDLLGYPEADLRRMNIRSMLHPDDPDQDLARQLQNVGFEGYRSERRLLHRDGSVVNVLLQAGIIRDANNQPMLMVVEMVDRTAAVNSMREAGELQERLTHAGRINTMGEMAAGIAHELNQPLVAIGTYANASRRLIENGSDEPGEIMGTLIKIAEQAERAGAVIRRLRTMLVHREHTLADVDCNHLIRELVPLAELDIHQHDFQLVLSLGAGLPLVKADGVQIQQVILNFIRNALDAMLETATGDEIRVVTRADGEGYVEIAVSDCGPGIGEESARRLFEPFYTTKPQGLGMGLAICRTIVELHNGELKCQNNRFGGATFVIRLPTSRHD
jgi:two-component system sensor kinase FixL